MLGAWWMLPIMILEPNVKSLAFNAFLQMSPQMLGYFNFLNKLNFFFACLVLFVVLMCSLPLYLLIFSSAKKSHSKRLLNFTKLTPSSFFLECSTRMLRDFASAFLEAYFLFDYRKQITSLMASQVVYIVLCIYFRRNYVNVFVFVFSTLYYVEFFLFNLVLMV